MNDFTLFFCSSSDIKKYAQSIPNPKVGCSTAGEIFGGLSKERIAMQKLSSKDFYIKTIKVDDPTLPIKYMENIKNCAADILKLKKHLICFVINDGLTAKEEVMQSYLFKILPKDTLIIGGSSGDDFNFKNTFCCIDDDVFSGSAIVLIGTDLNYYCNKENIYERNSNYTIITKGSGRNIIELDYKPAAERYAELLNSNINSISDIFSQHPFGISNNNDINDISIISPQKINKDLSITTYRSVVPSTVLWILSPTDYIKEIENTTSKILSHGKPIFTLTINCILRKALFDCDNSWSKLDNYFKKINAVGFVSYGEQLGFHHVNQTMITLSFYK